MLDKKRINKNYEMIYEGLEAVKLVEDPAVKAKLMMGFIAAKTLIEDNLDTIDRQSKTIEGFIDLFNTKTIKES